MKEHDDFERGENDPAVTEEEPNSVVTGRSLGEIAKSEDHVWNSKDTATGNAWYRKDGPGSAKSSAAGAKAGVADFGSALKKAPKEKRTDFIAPGHAVP